MYKMQEFNNMKPIKYISIEHRKAAHAQAQKRYLERKKNGTPFIPRGRKPRTPKIVAITDGEKPFTLSF